MKENLYKHINPSDNILISELSLKERKDRKKKNRNCLKPNIFQMKRIIKSWILQDLRKIL